MRRLVAIVVVAAALFAACDRIIELSPDSSIPPDAGAPDAGVTGDGSTNDGGNDGNFNDSAVPGDAAVPD